MPDDIYEQRDILLARIDERVGAIHSDMQSVKMEISGIKRDYVTRHE